MLVGAAHYFRPHHMFSPHGIEQKRVQKGLALPRTSHSGKIVLASSSRLRSTLARQQRQSFERTLLSQKH